MSKTTLRWWLFTCATFAAMIVATYLGFLDLLIKEDFTRISLFLVAMYIASTVSLGMKRRQGITDFGLERYAARTMSVLGIAGTFVGMRYAFGALHSLPADGSLPPEFVSDFMGAIGVKFDTSIVGIFGWIFLETQLFLLDPEEATA